MPHNITIDPEFHAKLRPLTESERLGLVKLLRRDGCREPISLWNGVIVDGHNRFEICEEEGILYATKNLKFKDRAEALQWIEDNQDARRHETPSQRAMRAAEMVTSTHGGARDTRNSCSTQPTVNKEVTISEASKIKEVSPAYTKKARVVLENAKPSEISAIKEGKKTVHEVHEALKVQAPPPSPLPDATATDEALELLKRLMAAVHAICGDGKDRRPMACGFYLSLSRQELEGHINEMRRDFRFDSPYAVCPYCEGKSKKCTGCKGCGWVGERAYDSAPPEMKARVKETIRE